MSMEHKNKAVNYDQISQIYDTGRAVHPETVEKLVRLLHAGINSKLLDMGCGTGNYTWALHRIAENTIGLDLSAGMLAQARGKYPEISFLRGDATNLPFKSETFDGAYAIQVLHHINDKGQFLRETFRILRKQAYIALHICSHKQMQAFWFYYYFPKGLDIDLGRMPDSHEVVAILEDAGFIDIGIEVCYRDVVVAGETPQRYLDKSYRDSISTFAFLDGEDVESGCRRILEDAASGEVKNIIRKSEEEIAHHTGGSCVIFGRKYNVSDNISSNDFARFTE